jgi:hypothetical protein
VLKEHPVVLAGVPEYGIVVVVVVGVIDLKGSDVGGLSQADTLFRFSKLQILPRG